MKAIVGNTIQEVTPQLLAQTFWELGDVEQAEFFNYLASYKLGRLAMQMSYVKACPELTVEGSGAMYTIGEYGNI